VPGFNTTKTQFFGEISGRILLRKLVRISRGVYRYRLAPCLVMVGSASTRCPCGGLRGLPGSRRSSGTSITARHPQLKIERFSPAVYLSKDCIASIDHNHTNCRADSVFKTLHIVSELIFLSDVLPTFTNNWRNVSELYLTEPVFWIFLREFQARSSYNGST
jgi:hypothetical protein